MKKASVFIALFIFLTKFNLHSQINQNCIYGQPVQFYYKPLCNNNSWELVFEDEFNGNTLDLEKWHDHQPWGDYPPPENVSLPENIFLNNGNIHLHVKPDGNYHYIFYQNNYYTYYYDYSGSDIWTKDFFLYGKFEIRAKIMEIEGLKAAFWLFGTPPWNEIDIFEFYDNRSDKLRMNVHYDIDGDEESENCSKSYIGPNFSWQFHTFTLIWEPYSIEWYLDGQLIRSLIKYRNISLQEIFCEDIQPYQLYHPELVFPDKPMPVILSSSVDKNNLSHMTPNWPKFMTIDYVRIWQRPTDNICCMPYKFFEGTENLPSLTRVDYNIRAGNDAGVPNTSGNVTVKSGQNVAFTAGSSIDLLPGFSVENGANFTAKNEDCNSLNQPIGGSIEIINFPNEFSDKLLVSVNGATSYDVWVSFLESGNTIYHSTGEIFTDPVCIWDGSCNFGSPNCWMYVMCPRTRLITVHFKNCTETISYTHAVNVSCNKNLIENNMESYKDENKTKEKENEIKNIVIKITPNPSEGIFNIISENIDNTLLNISVYNYLSKPVSFGNLNKNDNNVQIDLQGNPSGIYLLKIIYKNESYLYKLVLL